MRVLDTVLVVNKYKYYINCSDKYSYSIGYRDDPELASFTKGLYTNTVLGPNALV